MKTNKKAISLIVLVITIIVLAILAATVIITLSNTNIMEQASNAAFRSDMANYKQAASLYVTSQMAENKTGDDSNINLAPGDADYTSVFGEVPSKYEGKLSIVGGKLVYETEVQSEVDVLEEMGIASSADEVGSDDVVQGPIIGEKVIYTPNSVTQSSTYGIGDETNYNTLISEGLTAYPKDDLTWLYLGEINGKTLLISETTTSNVFTAAEFLTDDFIEADNLCNELYNSSIATARNLKIEDVNAILGYTEPTFQTRNDYEALNNDYLQTSLDGGTLIDSYTYNGIDYCESTDDLKYRVLFTNFSSGAMLPKYSLSSTSISVSSPYISLDVRYVENAVIKYWSTGAESAPYPGALYDSYLRPVIVLNDNIAFGEKTASGWTLIEN